MSEEQDLVVDGEDVSRREKQQALTPANRVLSTGVVTAPRRKRKVLREEEYLSTLGAILRRDFFPSLAKLEAQYEYLTAVERADLAAVRESAQRLNTLEAGGGAGAEAAPKMSLDEFQARYVTEDTRDFEVLLERINALRRQKFTKVFKAPALTGSTANSTQLFITDNVSVASSKAHVRPSNTKIEKEIELGVLERDPTDLRYHYWRMLKEFGKPDDEVHSQSITSSVGGVSQMGGVGEYDLVDTPVTTIKVMATPERTFRIPPTPQRELMGHRIAATVVKGSSGRLGMTDQRSSLLRSPAVRRLLRAHTPKAGSAFDPSLIPKRKL